METPIPFLDLKLQNQGLKVELLEVFAKAVDHAAFVGGAEVEAFEREFAQYVGCPHVVGVANGTDALRFALLAMGITQGDRVVTVPNSFIATTEAITQAGAKIDFVDVDPATSLMDPNRLAEFLKKRFESKDKSLRVKAIVPVHLYGQCADMDAILELSKKYEVQILEDAAQAHGALYKGKLAGSFGHAAGFSFYPGKNLGACGEAGAVSTHDAKIAEKIRIIRDHGQKVKYLHSIEGYNGRLDAIQAGFLRVKLKHLPKWNERRRIHSDAYDSAFSKLSWLKPVDIKSYNVSSRHLYVVHSTKRDGLREHLLSLGIQSAFHYPMPLHLQEAYLDLGHKKGDFPQTEKLAAELLSLPLFPELTEEQRNQVIEGVRSFPGAL